MQNTLTCRRALFPPDFFETHLNFCVCSFASDYAQVVCVPASLCGCTSPCEVILRIVTCKLLKIIKIVCTEILVLFSDEVPHSPGFELEGGLCLVFSRHCVATLIFSRSEQVHRPRSYFSLHFDIRHVQQICMEK